MSAVYKRELRAYMNNVYGWLFMAILLMFAGFMVFLDNVYNGYPNFEYALSDSQYALMILIPILCMRSMAEDKHNKTDMFYLSLPMSTTSVVLGKYFAMLTVLAVPCAALCVYPLILGLLGEVNMTVAYLAVLQFFLLGAALIAVCQFTSSLSDNLVVAAVLGEDTFEGLLLRNTETGEESVLNVDGTFVCIGQVPANQAFSDVVKLNDYGYVDAGESCLPETTIPGVFVAGDCRTKAIRQVTTATADGTVAALAACRYLDTL